MIKTITLSLIFVSCLSVSKAQQNNKNIKLEFFGKIPVEIDGCEGDYTNDTLSLKKKKYLLITNVQDLAFIQVEGKKISLTRKGEIQFSNNKYKSIYQGGGYTIILITTAGKEVDESVSERGTLEISNGSNKIVIKIHGISGC